jgi:tight adherence protein B
VYVTATNRAGRVVTDLRAEDVSIRLDGKPVGPISLSRQRTEISAVLIIDTSFSMRAWLNAMSSVALEFFSHLQPPDRALVTEMNGQVRLPRAFTSNRDGLSAQLNLQAINATHFFDTVVASADALRNESARRVVLVLTDGEDTGSTRASFNTALQRVQADNVIAYVVGFESVDARTRIRIRPSRDLKRLAEETGGGYFEFTEKVDVKAAIETVFNELHNQYVLTFTPPQSDDKRRKLELATSRPDVSLRARTSYVARP